MYDQRSAPRLLALCLPGTSPCLMVGMPPCPSSQWQLYLTSRPRSIPHSSRPLQLPASSEGSPVGSAVKPEFLPVLSVLFSGGGFCSRTPTLRPNIGITAMHHPAGFYVSLFFTFTRLALYPPSHPIGLGKKKKSNPFMAKRTDELNFNTPVNPALRKLRQRNSPRLA